MNKLAISRAEVKIKKRPGKCYEMWILLSTGHFKMAGTSYMSGKQLQKACVANPHIHYVIHKGTIRMWCRFVVARMFGFN